MAGNRSTLASGVCVIAIPVPNPRFRRRGAGMVSIVEPGATRAPELFRWATRSMIDAIVRVAGREELERIRETYLEWGYDGGAEPSDVILLAERESQFLGIVRCTTEFGVVMLRGMQVAPAARRQGLGGKLLDAFLQQLGERECYCVPYAHLVPFYGRIGFDVWPLERGPVFLRDRIAGYRAKGLDVTLMRRPAA